MSSKLPPPAPPGPRRRCGSCRSQSRRRAGRRGRADRRRRKALEARLAVGVDLAAVELLALVLVADDLVGRVDFGKARSGLRIVLVAVGVMLLGELAIGALDRRSAGAPRHPQDLIGVAHTSRLLHGNSVSNFRADCPLCLHLGAQWHFCNWPPSLKGSIALSCAATALAYEFPIGPGRPCRRRPAASFRCGR